MRTFSVIPSKSIPANILGKLDKNVVKTLDKCVKNGTITGWESYYADNGQKENLHHYLLTVGDKSLGMMVHAAFTINSVILYPVDLAEGTYIPSRGEKNALICTLQDLEKGIKSMTR